ncbi:hypothetical protein AAZX31_19G170400 [Glycine max]|uniref:Uncharacterized protein n=1 Tax=Glycine max TaxID=3847 RepID=K7MZ31_SOYBN|nr:uncharacterized protein LOC102664707 [Glycine max]XP_028217937.1 uncharacterized protein LOC114399915 isoform X2 [Glycine soja]KAH1078500.1 hypothetical protein GYH30_053488 [Glycine max]KRG96032.1 hypothetical protein GLYMA_19G185100v4 [Glycine max]|eukprot:XP_006604585.1 uncharacterized protein LOC102664707 [Glycine max]
MSLSFALFAWTFGPVGGEHHICCLPCGHIYDMSSIQKWLQHRRNSNKIIQSLEAKSTALESKDNDWRKKEAEWHKREASLHLQVEKLTQEPRRWNSFIEH